MEIRRRIDGESTKMCQLGLINSFLCKNIFVESPILKDHGYNVTQMSYDFKSVEKRVTLNGGMNQFKSVEKRVTLNGKTPFLLKILLMILN